MIFSRVVAREVGRGDVGDRLGVDANDLHTLGRREGDGLTLTYFPPSTIILCRLRRRHVVFTRVSLIAAKYSSVTGTMGYLINLDILKRRINDNANLRTANHVSGDSELIDLTTSIPLPRIRLQHLGTLSYTHHCHIQGLLFIASGHRPSRQWQHRWHDSLAGTPPKGSAFDHQANASPDSRPCLCAKSRPLTSAMQNPQPTRDQTH